MTEINLVGHTPSKKNLLKLTKSGHGYYDADTRNAINNLNEQVAAQWVHRNRDGGMVARSPLLHPALAVVFYVVSERSDRDNKLTTIMDALVAGGVLKDDCTALCNGPVLLCSAVVTEHDAGVKVIIQDDGDFERLWRYVKAQDLDHYQWLKDMKVDRATVASKVKRGLKKV